jgi:hypothetical protein
MAQTTSKPQRPATPPLNLSPAPTIYLSGFFCSPDDREYTQAKKTTGNNSPYWFREIRGYESAAEQEYVQALRAAATAMVEKRKGKEVKERRSGVEEVVEGVSELSVLERREERKRRLLNPGQAAGSVERRKKGNRRSAFSVHVPAFWGRGTNMVEEESEEEGQDEEEMRPKTTDIHIPAPAPTVSPVSWQPQSQLEQVPTVYGSSV